MLLGGHLMTIFLKEKLLEYLLGIRGSLMKEIRNDPSKVDLFDSAWLKKAMDRQADIGKKVYYFLATGNIVSSTGLDLMQVAGYTIVAEKLNHWRYLSHFRSVHRGQFFTEMKTTSPRKLLPESWGFLCCVGVSSANHALGTHSRWCSLRSAEPLNRGLYGYHGQHGSPCSGGSLPCIGYGPCSHE